MKRQTGNCICAIVLAAVAVLLQGCGGGGTQRSVISGTISDINRNLIVDARVWVDGHETQSLQTGAYRLDGVSSGWRTVWASARINGETWIGSTAAEVLEGEPTMNIHITLAPSRDTTEIRGYVEDDDGYPMRGARVLLTTRLLDPPEATDPYDGPYGSIVAVTGDDGEYLMENVPVGLDAVISASKVGFYNEERSITTADVNQLVDFSMDPSDLQYKMEPPLLDGIESYTMPDAVTRSGVDPYRAVQAITSPRFLRTAAKRTTTMTRSTPEGSLIEIDLYWNALDVNYPDEVAGYGIYRGSSPSTAKAIDFIRDPYANFYGDTDIAITPYSWYYYAVTAVDVEFLDARNRPDPNAESDKSEWMSISPLGQLRSDAPAQGASVSGDPLFDWSALSQAAYYKVFVYDEFPTLAADPSRDYTSPTPPPGVVTLPIWPRTLDSTETRVPAGTTSLRYNGPELVPGHTYYWLVMAKDDSGAATSYSELRHFTAR